MSNHKDDKALEEYLQGGSDLSRRYQAGKQEGPPGHLDDSIIRAARAALMKKAAPRARNWYVPLSIAAVVVIGVSIVFRMYEYKGRQLLTGPGPEQLMDKSSGRNVEGESAGTKPAGAAPAAPAPQTLPQKMEKDDMQGETLPKEISVEAAKRRAVEPAQPVEDIAIPAMKMEQRVAPEGGMSLREEEASREKRAPTAAAESRVLSAAEWLKNIRHLWVAGKKDEAVAGLKQFLDAYPHYPHDEIIRQLPGDFDPATYISGFEKN